MYLVANLHTHPNEHDDGIGPGWQEGPSPEDLLLAQQWKLPGFVIRPGGAVHEYGPDRARQ